MKMSVWDRLKYPLEIIEAQGIFTNPEAIEAPGKVAVSAGTDTSRSGRS